MRKKRNVSTMEESIPSIVPKSYQNSKQKIKLEHLKTILPLTDNQRFAFQEYAQNQNLMLHGVSGTGKTLISLYCALKDLLTKSNGFDKIIIIKTIQSVKSIGYLKGTLQEKIEPYEAPFKELCNELLPNITNPYDQLKEQGLLEFHCTSFMRGISFHNTIVIVDEVQNLSFIEADMVLSRIGNNSKILLAGDFYQSDADKTYKSGFDNVLKIIKYMDEFTDIEFDVGDIVRSGFCKNYILARLKLGL